MIKSHPTLYAKDYRFIEEYGEVQPLQNFFLTGKGSQCTSNDIRYYWRLVQGTPPNIVEIINEGESIRFVAPKNPTEIVFELKVKDLQTEETDTKNIMVRVTKESI